MAFIRLIIVADSPQSFREAVEGNREYSLINWEKVGNKKVLVFEREVKITKFQPVFTPDGVFDRFWSAYPIKKAKVTALKSWQKIKPAEYSAIMDALDKQKRTEDWAKEDGKYIPQPTTWLNQRRWEDDVKVMSPQKKWQKEINALDKRKRANLNRPADEREIGELIKSLENTEIKYSLTID